MVYFVERYQKQEEFRDKDGNVPFEASYVAAVASTMDEAEKFVDANMVTLGITERFEITPRRVGINPVRLSRNRAFDLALTTFDAVIDAEPEVDVVEEPVNMPTFDMDTDSFKVAGIA